MYNCDTSPVNQLSYPPNYAELKRKFTDFIAASKLQITEGNSGDGNVDVQYKFYHHVSRQPWVRTICETGFNGGHSAFQWLAFTPNTTRLRSFDICGHDYTLPMAAYINATFPGRFHLTCGDSTKTLASVPDLKNTCDLVIVDGGHSYGVAMADLRHFQPLANPDRHIVIVDDVPNIGAVKQAWKAAISQDWVQELFVCTAASGRRRGFAVGIYN